MGFDDGLAPLRPLPPPLPVPIDVPDPGSLRTSPVSVAAISSNCHRAPAIMPSSRSLSLSTTSSSDDDLVVYRKASR